jgi:hypothetical protein
VVRLCGHVMPRGRRVLPDGAVGWIKRSGSTKQRLVDPLRLIHPTERRLVPRLHPSAQKLLHHFVEFLRIFQEHKMAATLFRIKHFQLRAFNLLRDPFLRL